MTTITEAHCIYLHNYNEIWNEYKEQLKVYSLWRDEKVKPLQIARMDITMEMNGNTKEVPAFIYYIQENGNPTFI